MLGAAHGFVLVAFVSVLVIEKRRDEAMKERMPQVLVCSKQKSGGRIALMILAAILLVVGSLALICGSLLIEPIPREDFGAYAAIVGLIAFGGLFCLCGILCTVYNANYATEDGIWVRRVFFKTKFFSYDEVESIWDGTYNWNGGWGVYKKERKLICFVRKREQNAKELMAAIKEHSPRLGKLKENELFRM